MALGTASVAAGGDDGRPGGLRPSADPSGVVRPDGEADRRLLAEIEAADNSFADHYDRGRYDRDMAEAFRRYGLDLDKVEPKVAGEETWQPGIDGRARFGDRPMVLRAAVSAEGCELAAIGRSGQGSGSGPVAELSSRSIRTSVERGAARASAHGPPRPGNWTSSLARACCCWPTCCTQWTTRRLRLPWHALEYGGSRETMGAGSSWEFST